MDKQKIKRAALARKKRRTRKHIFGTPDRPRLSVFRSGRHIYGQVVDDTRGVTLVAASSMTKGLRGETSGLKGTEVAAKVGADLASKATAAGVQAVVFDRNGRNFTGRVKALADAARSNGLQF